MWVNPTVIFFIIRIEISYQFHRLRTVPYTVPVLRIRHKSFGSGFGSGSGLKLPSSGSGFESRIGIRIRILDSVLDQKLAKTSFFVQKLLPCLIFKHKKNRPPSLSSMTWLWTRCTTNFQDSDPDPYQKVTDRQHCVQLLVNVSYPPPPPPTPPPHA